MFATRLAFRRRPPDDARPVAIRPDQRAHLRDPFVLGAVASATGAIRALGPRTTRPPLAALGDLYTRLPLNRRRLDRATANIRWCFPDLDERAARAVARASWRHLFLLGAEMSVGPRPYRFACWPDWIEPPAAPDAVRTLLEGPAILVTGHCGNWELMGAWLGTLGLPIHAVYRPLDNRALDGWVRRTRSRLGIDLVDKFGAFEIMPKILDRGEPVAFTADQDAGEHGLFVPFFDRLASSYKSIGLLAIKYEIPVVCGGAVRVSHATDPLHLGPLRYRIHVADVIHPQDWADEPDPLFTITARYRRAIESLVRLAPEQFLWMQTPWRRRPRFQRRGRPTPSSLLAKLERLPWMTPASLARIVAASSSVQPERPHR